jgi:PAS domain S-box-containing protein
MVEKNAINYLAGGGTMGARMRALDWAATPLGPAEFWPRSLSAIVQMMLNSRFAMWMAWGPDLTFFCNDAYLPTTGLRSPWVLGARSDKVWAEIWSDIWPRIDRVLRTGEATWDEALLLYLERSGFTEETYHTFSYSPLADDTGAIAGMLCVVAEVTDGVIGERQLASLRELGTRLAGASTREAVMRALEACLALDPRDVPFATAYLYDAGSNVAHLACRHGALAGTAVSPEFVDLSSDTATLPFGRVLRDGAQVIDIAGSDTGGEPARGRAFITPIAGAEGGPPAGFLIAGLNSRRPFDVTYRGFLDLLTGQLAAALARADEYERERARAEALAEIDRAKTAFFSNVSHEFRTPLTLMLGPLEDALEGAAADPAALPDGHADMLSLVHRNGLRLLRLVNGLLDFSRIQAGRVDARYRPVDLAAFTVELASTFGSTFERAGLRFTVTCPPLSQPVFVDREMWEKIVLNLLSNAFKFTLEGAVTLALAEGPGVAELTVSDTGVGIPAAELPRLFERFHRVDGVTGRSFEGSGIGLALVHDLVQLHGGEIDVESEPGRGTSFRVRLPLGSAHLAPERVEHAVSDTVPGARAQAFAEEARRWLADAPGEAAFDQVIDDIDRESLSAGADTEAGGEGGRVLLVDDNADLREYVGRLLRARGYQVETVNDGLQALQAAGARRPDLVLTDVMMPGLDGFGLLAAIRADASLADLPVIMLSARAGEEAQVDGLGAGADDYLAKPFSARELLARVAANLHISRTRREALAAVRASEGRLRGVLEGMAEGFVLLDRDFVITEVNDEALRLDGRPREALVGRSHWEAYPNTQASRIGELYRHAMQTREPVSLEHSYEWEPGREAWLDMRAYPDGGDGLAIFFRDVTDRRRAQDDLRLANETLERRVAEAVAEREAALARLHEAQKLETIGQLTGGVAHDFNNLLTPVMGGLELLRRWHPDERSQRVVGGAMQSAERAKTLVQRLLAFARRSTLTPQSVDPATLLLGMRELLDHSLGAGIRVQVAVPPTLPAILVDPNQLELALLNLAVNARDAMEGGGTLAIRADEEEVAGDASGGLASGRYIRFQVTDTGRGMDSETLRRAVEPFFSTKALGKGTGLGLSMVHGLALQSGGAFRLTSAPGAGSTATLWIPVSAEAAAPPAPAPMPARPAARPAAVLLVDDEDLVRTSTASVLRELGYQVREAASAAEALAVMRAGTPPDVVVTDHMMPGMTGAQLATELRRYSAGLPILMITGFASLTPEQTFGLDVLAKPFSLGDLASRVAGLLEGAGR